MDPGWWGVGIGALGLIGGAIGFVRSIFAGRSAARAEAAAADALSRSAAAAEESAAALKRANEIAEASLPPDGVLWGLIHVRDARYVLKNIGNRTAEGATLHDMTDPDGKERWVRRESWEPVDVPPGDVIDFLVLSASGTPNVKVQLRWREGDGPLRTDDTTIVV